MAFTAADGRDLSGVNPAGRTHKGGENGLDVALVHSPSVNGNHVSHKLPVMTCNYSGGCKTRLVWTKVQRIMSGTEDPEDWFCFRHKKEAEKT